MALGFPPRTDQDMAVGRPWREQDLVQPGPASPGCAAPWGRVPLPWGSGGARLCSGPGRLQRRGRGWSPPAPPPTPAPGSGCKRQRGTKAACGGHRVSALPAGRPRGRTRGPCPGLGARQHVLGGWRGGGESGWGCHRSLAAAIASHSTRGTPRTPLGVGTQGSGLHLPLQRQYWGWGGWGPLSWTPLVCQFLQCLRSCPLQCPQGRRRELSWA